MPHAQKRPRDEADLAEERPRKMARIMPLPPLTKASNCSPSPSVVVDLIRASPRLSVATKLRLFALLSQHRLRAASRGLDGASPASVASSTTTQSGPSVSRLAGPPVMPRRAIHPSPLGPRPLPAPKLITVASAKTRRDRDYRRTALQHAWISGQPTLKQLRDEEELDVPGKIREMARAHEAAQRLHHQLVRTIGRCGYRAPAPTGGASLWAARK